MKLKPAVLALVFWAILFGSLAVSFADELLTFEGEQARKLWAVRQAGQPLYLPSGPRKTGPYGKINQEYTMLGEKVALDHDRAKQGNVNWLVVHVGKREQRCVHDPALVKFVQEGQARAHKLKQHRQAAVDFVQKGLDQRPRQKLASDQRKNWGYHNDPAYRVKVDAWVAAERARAQNYIKQVDQEMARISAEIDRYQEPGAPIGTPRQSSAGPPRQGWSPPPVQQGGAPPKPPSHGKGLMEVEWMGIGN